MFLYNIKSWWECHIQHTEFSSGYILIDLLRLLSIPLAFLAFPSIYIGLGIRITFSIIFFAIIIIGIVIYCLTKDARASLQSMVLTAIFLTVGYIFVILAETLLVLYCTCAISFLILQDWTYRISFERQNNKSLLEYIARNDKLSKMKRVRELILYLIVIIGSLTTSYMHWDKTYYEQLKKENINFVSNYSIQEQLYNNSFTQKIANSNWNNGLEQSESLFDIIWDIIQNFKWVQDIIQSLENFKELIGYLGLIMIGVTIVSFFLPIAMRHFKELVSE